MNKRPFRRSCEWRSFDLLFLCPKMAKIVGGVTAGVTKWGYIFRKVGLHIRGFRGYDRGGGKRIVLRDKVGETTHLRYW